MHSKFKEDPTSETIFILLLDPTAKPTSWGYAAGEEFL
jgi:hypothetical protein